MASAEEGATAARIEMAKRALRNTRETLPVPKQPSSVLHRILALQDVAPTCATHHESEVAHHDVIMQL